MGSLISVIISSAFNSYLFDKNIKRYFDVDVFPTNRYKYDYMPFQLPMESEYDFWND